MKICEKVVLEDEMRYNNSTNVPVAQTVAERPSLLKCYYRSGFRSWAMIGPQVISSFSFFPFVKNRINSVLPVLQTLPQKLQFHREAIWPKRTRGNVCDNITALNQRTFIRRAQRYFDFRSRMDKRIIAQYLCPKRLLFKPSPNIFVAMQRSHHDSIQHRFHKLHTDLMSHYRRFWPNRFRLKSVPFVQQNNSDKGVLLQKQSQHVGKYFWGQPVSFQFHILRNTVFQLDQSKLRFNLITINNRDNPAP